MLSQISMMGYHFLYYFYKYCRSCINNQTLMASPNIEPEIKQKFNTVWGLI